MFDLVLGLEMRNGGGIGPRVLVAAALDAAVDEVLHACGDGAVDEGLALGDFALDGHAGAETDLDGVDTVDGLRGGGGGGGFEDGAGGLEEGGDVV